MPNATARFTANLDATASAGDWRHYFASAAKMTDAQRVALALDWQATRGKFGALATLYRFQSERVAALALDTDARATAVAALDAIGHALAHYCRWTGHARHLDASVSHACGC